MVNPNRGGIFWLEMEIEGRHPSEVLLDVEDGMPRQCAISLDNLRTVPKALLVEPITVLGAQRIDELCRALAAVSGC